MGKRDIKVFDNSVFVDSWDYRKPNMKPNEDGEVELVFQLCFGPCEWWKRSMDADDAKIFWGLWFR